MAGSYNHVVTKSGNLASNKRVVDMLENGGDVFEAVEEMYGMIWWLASEYINQNLIALVALEVDPTRRFNAIKDVVEKARQNYDKGLKFSLEIHRVTPN